MKIMNIVGAHPEFIQTAPVTRALSKRHTQILVHTSQHYDDKEKLLRCFTQRLTLQGNTRNSKTSRTSSNKYPT
jgi:UDP-N-acetylglucosamine 2-epimerase